MSRQAPHKWELQRDLSYPWSRYRCRVCGCNVESPHGPPSYALPVRWEGRRIEKAERRPDCLARVPGRWVQGRPKLCKDPCTSESPTLAGG